jgi:DNA sulfur modification protein DndB
LRSALKAHRVVNTKRVPEIARYVAKNRDSYVISALTASVDTEVTFQTESDESVTASAGVLRVPMAATFTLHDGLHRCAALKAAVRANPELRAETVTLVLFVDPAGQRADQIYTDLKRHERKIPRSLSILHDDRDEMARLTREIVPLVPVFADTTEMAKTTISNRSRKLFTLSAIYHANKILLARVKGKSYDEKRDLAAAFWNATAACVPAWSRAAGGDVTSAALRAEFIHSHGIALSALARVGCTLLANQPKGWKRRLSGLKTLDWSRGNTKMWEGRAMIGGRLSKASNCLVLTGNAIKSHLGIELDDDERAVETRFLARGKI